MSITSEYRKMHQFQNLKENIYQDINDVIKDFQDKLDPLILKKDLNNGIKLQLTDLNDTLEKLLSRQGDLYSLRSNENDDQL